MINFNIINNNKLKKITAVTLTTAVIGSSALMLSGCNKDLIDTNKTFDKAIIIGDGIVTIYDIKQYVPYGTERYQLKLPDNTYIMTSTVTTRFVNTKSSNIDINEFVKTLVPEDYKVINVGESELHQMKKTR